VFLSKYRFLSFLFLTALVVGIAGASACPAQSDCSCCPDDSSNSMDSVQCASTAAVQMKTFGPTLELFIVARSNFEARPIENIFCLGDLQFLDIFSPNKSANLPHAPPIV
jgi:hypothetical protein